MPWIITVGTTLENQAGGSVPVPAHAAGHDQYLYVNTSNADTVSFSNAANFVEVQDSPQGTGAGTGAGGECKLSVFHRRCTSGAEASPVLNDTGNYQFAYIVNVVGGIGSGSPFADTAGDVEATQVTSVSIPGGSTPVDGCLILGAVAYGMDNATPAASGYSNGDLDDIGEVADLATAVGHGGGIAIMKGIKAVAGSFGVTTASLINASMQGRIMLALLPAVAEEGGSLPFNATVAAGGWQDNAGAAEDLHSPLNDDSEATWIQSPASPSNATVKLGITDGVGTQLVAAVTLTLDAHQASTGTDSDLTVEFRESGTLRATRLIEPLEDVADPGNRWEIKLTQAELGDITNWDNVEAWAVANGGTRPIRITRARLTVTLAEPNRSGMLFWAELEVPDDPSRRGVFYWAEFEVPNVPTGAPPPKPRKPPRKGRRRR